MSKVLYKYTKSGKVQQWISYAEGSDVVSVYGQLDGKLTTSRYTCEAKNVGRSNETTPEGQAILEVKALYEDQINNNHYRYTLEEAQGVVNSCIVPMKISNYKDHPNKVSFPCLVGVKLNGSRAMFKDGKVVSKAGRVETFKVKHILDQVNQLSVDVDGEVYRHGWSLQRIQSARNKPNSDTPELMLYIFDIPNKELTVEERTSKLDDLRIEIAEKQLPNLAVVTKETISSLEDLNKYFEEVTPEYEGIVIWNIGSTYEFGVRSNKVLKWKPRYDSEAKVVNVTKDKSGSGVLHLVACDALDNVTFKCMMKVKRRDGNEYPRDFDSMSTLIGQWITFSYEELSEAGKPTKPVGECLRTCDDQGNPLE